MKVDNIYNQQILRNITEIKRVLDYTKKTIEDVEKEFVETGDVDCLDELLQTLHQMLPNMQVFKINRNVLRAITKELEKLS